MSSNGNGGTSRNFSRLTLADLGDNDAVIATITKARIQSFSGDYLSEKDRRVVLNFEAFGDKDYVLNATSYGHLAERYGRGVDNGFADWIGRECVLIKTKTKDLQDQPMTSVWVAGPADWAAAMRSLEPAKKPAKRAAKRSR